MRIYVFVLVSSIAVVLLFSSAIAGTIDPAIFLNQEQTIPQASRVELWIYNTIGQLVRTLVDDELKPGGYSVIWDSKDKSGMEVASEVYIYRLKAGDFQESKRMVLLK